MRTYTQGELCDTLDGVDVGAGDAVLVHSSLFELGLLRDCPPRDLAARLTDTILDHIGPRGTLVVPAFNFGFCKGDPFDRQRTPSEGMGALSECVRTHPESRRTSHPMQSFAAIGPLADDLAAQDTPSSFDEDGPFAVLLSAGAKLVLLGAPMQAASAVHYAEERTGVPYRYWKDFTGPYIDAGQTETRTYRMYVRDLELDPKLDLSVVETWLSDADELATRPIGGGTVKACHLADFITTTVEHLKADPWCLVGNRETVEIEARGGDQ